MRRDGFALRFATSVCRSDLDIVLVAMRTSVGCADPYVQCQASGVSLWKAVRSCIAVVGETAPVLNIQRICRRISLRMPGHLEVILNMLGGKELVVRASEDATLADLAGLLAERLAAPSVYLVLPDEGVVTPWECRKLVADFADSVDV